MLKNEFLEIDFVYERGEVKSIKRVNSNENLTWCGDPLHWDRSNPILFPFIGKLIDGEYSFNGIDYKMGGHGFARESNFIISHETDTEIVFTNQFSDETLKCYPFKYRLDIKHTLDGSKLTTEYIVTNLDDRKIYFFLGGHPSLSFTGSINDNYIEFENSEVIDKFKLDNALFCHEKKRVFESTKKIPLNYELFNEDALVLENIKSKKILLKNNIDNSYLEFEHNYNLIAFWTKDDCPFICFEPWEGHGDFIDGPKDITKKDGILNLGVGEIFSRFYSISVIEGQ